MCTMRSFVCTLFLFFFINSLTHKTNTLFSYEAARVCVYVVSPRHSLYCLIKKNVSYLPVRCGRIAIITLMMHWKPVGFAGVVIILKEPMNSSDAAIEHVLLTCHRAVFDRFNAL